ncbi:hypothetical protein MD588_03800 [Photobacterium sp. SDRW27]|uniref:hypothetical protein n=1 Tax=Photobacterium obscurum TaxID=2829490 RepID=UPI002242F7B6|nr:hypothetical protein [Photobacterium obscurum]MCW8327923.1 hypothetical protein [Photobacterium obscurum]
MKYLLFMFITSLALSGCGGGSSGDNSSNDSGDSTTTFDQIIIPDGFNLRTSYAVNLNIDLSTTDPMYLSVYGNPTVTLNGDIIADTSSRIIAGELNNGQFNGKFTATSGLSSILVEAWHFDGTHLPFRKIIKLPQENIVIQN